MIPSKSDLDKRRKNADKLRKKITPDGRLLEKELVRIVRKAVDSAWMKAAHKLVFLEDRVIPDMDESTRTKWLIRCNICDNLFKLTDVDIDHKVGEFACTVPEDFHSYIMSRLDVGFDDLQVLCRDIPNKGHIGCHSIKTYAERNGMTFEEASKMKIIIDLEKKKMLQDFIKSKGEKPASNAEKRREQALRLLKQEKENGQN